MSKELGVEGTCKDKTKKGNVYEDLEAAGIAARQIRKKAKPIECLVYPYECQYCGLLHVGKNPNWERDKEKLKAKWNRQEEKQRAQEYRKAHEV